MNSKGLLSAEFRHRSYDDQEQEHLRRAIGDDFEIELTPQQIPEAGGSTEIWLFLRSPPGWIVSAMLSGVAYDVIKALAKRLVVWSTQYKSRQPHHIAPEVVSFTLQLNGMQFRFEDGRHRESPDVHFMGALHLGVLDEIVSQTLLFVPIATLLERDIQAVTVPVFASSSSEWFYAQYWTLVSKDGRKYLFNCFEGTFGPEAVDRFAPERADIASGLG